MNPKKTLNIGLLFLIVMGFMLINTELFFPDNVEEMRIIILVYTALTGFFLAYANEHSPLSKIKTIPGLVKIGTYAAVTYIIVGAFSSNALGAGLLDINIPIAFALFTAFVVAFSEELIFRGVLKPRLGNIPQAAVFSIYHFAVSGGNVWNLIIFFALGVAWGKLNDLNGGSLTASIGSHTGWNLVAASVATIIST